MGFENPVDMNYLTLTLNGQSFQDKALNFLCQQKLSDENLPDWERNLYWFIQDWISKDPYIEVNTSGSTGAPKQIRIEKNKMIQSALMTCKFFDLKKTDKALLCLPVEYIAGKMMVVRSFVLGLNLIPIEPKGNPLDGVNNDLVFAAMTPLQVSNILIKSDGIKKLNKIKKLIIGGADINPELLRRIRLLKNETWQTYGMTETISHVAVRKLIPPGESENYKALPGVKFGKDERDCLIIHAPHLSDPKVISNDIVELKNETEFKLNGRYDNIINSGGIKLSPEEIEKKMIPYIRQRFIIAGFPDKKLGQKLTIIIEGQKSEPLALKDLAERACLSVYEIPKQMIYSLRFPLTENGKIIRNEVIKHCTSENQ
jgi:O-succinylbenzoic acid--CoA ligase